MKPSELTDAQLAVMVAVVVKPEGVKVEGSPFEGKDIETGVWPWYVRRGRFKVWNPISRADHWWMVVEWVRGQENKPEEDYWPIEEFLEGVLPPGGHFWGSDIGWFLMECKRPGRAICEAFVEVFCEVD